MARTTASSRGCRCCGPRSASRFSSRSWCTVYSPGR
jgi:hypothetical protein